MHGIPFHPKSKYLYKCSLDGSQSATFCTAMFFILIPRRNEGGKCNRGVQNLIDCYSISQCCYYVTVAYYAEKI